MQKTFDLLNELLASKYDLKKLSEQGIYYSIDDDHQSPEDVLSRIKSLTNLYHVDVRISYESGIPKIRYISGLTVYDEALVNSRWIGRYWAADGKVTAETHIWEVLNDTVTTLPLHSFRIEIDSQSLHTYWQCSGAIQYYDIEKGAIHVIVKLVNRIRPIEVEIHTLLNGTPFLNRWLTITNCSNSPAALSSLATWSGALWTKRINSYYQDNKPDSYFTLGYFASSLSHWEGDFVWKPLTNGTFRIEGRRGHSGYGLPFFMVRNEVTGETFICHLEWSGNWYTDFMCDVEPHGEEANLVFSIGPAGTAPQRIISVGETVTTPAVHLACIQGDLDECVQATHTHLRRSVIPLPSDDKKFLVKYSTLNESAAYFPDKSNYEQDVLNQVDIAADLGCELFIVENAWHGKQATHGSWGIAGDWFPNAWLPNGLSVIRKYVRSKGMLFGLYLEIETIGFDSDLFAQHPDWAMTRDGNVATGWQRTKRALLDLTKPEVAAWMESEIFRIIQEFDLDLFRLDANVRYLYEGGQRIDNGYLESTFWRYYQTLYEIWDRVRKKFPNVILQQASSGGCRNDIGIMRHFNEAFLTDALHVPRELYAFNGLTLALPPEIFNNMAGLVWPSTEPRGPFETHLRISTILSHPYIADVGVMPPNSGPINSYRLDRHKRYIKLFKEFVRPMLTDCKMYHHAPITSKTSGKDWFVIEYASPDHLHGVALLIRLEQAKEQNFHFRPRGLHRGMSYKVHLDNSNQSYIISGRELMQTGLIIDIENLYGSELLLFESVSQ